MPHSPRQARAALRRLILLLVGALVVGLAVTARSSAEDGAERQPVPEAVCGPGARPETDIQGRVPKADFDSGRYRDGYLCNTAEAAHEGSSGGFKTLRYTDAQGHTCAFYDSTALVPPTSTLTNLLTGKGIGVVVLDMDDPTRPRRTTTLVSPAMLSPHESLLVNEARGLLIATVGNVLTAPGILDVYDVRTDCRKPKLLSSTPSGVLGHESGFSPDGNTVYTSSTLISLAAIDVSNPRLPRTIYTELGRQYHGLRLSDDGRTLYAAHIGEPGPNLVSGGGLRIHDVSQIQDRARNPKAPILSTMTWHGSAIPQVAQPFTRDGHRYLLEVDEFVDLFSFSGLLNIKNAPVGAARIINVDDPRHPYQVSDIRLAVHQPDVHAGEQTKDPGAGSPLGGYAALYCSVPTRDNPDIAGCSMILSGLRLFDIRDVENPREIGYFNKPDAGGGAAYSQPAWDPTTDTVWYTDEATGLWVVRLTNGLQHLLR